MECAAFSEVEAKPLDIAQVENCRVRGSLATCSQANQSLGARLLNFASRK